MFDFDIEPLILWFEVTFSGRPLPHVALPICVLVSNESSSELTLVMVMAYLPNAILSVPWFLML